MLSIVIVSWNTREVLRRCLASTERHLSEREVETIVVDNASSDGSASMVATDFPAARLIRNVGNVGFGRASNQGMRVARGAWLLLLNSDTMLVDDSVALLHQRLLQTHDVGVAQCQLWLEDGRIQHSAYRFPSVGLALLEAVGAYKLLPKRIVGPLMLAGHWSYTSERDVDWVSGAFMLVPAEVYRATQGFDEAIFMYGEDMEWCYRIRDRGWRVRYYPSAKIIHMRHASADQWFGDPRVALCLRRQHEIVRARSGAPRAFTLLTVDMLGALLRVGYYSIRVALGGAKGRTYLSWQHHYVVVVRGLMATLLSSLRSQRTHLACRR